MEYQRCSFLELKLLEDNMRSENLDSEKSEILVTEVVTALAEVGGWLSSEFRV